MPFLTPEDRDDIISAIDRYAWKHSWHLPKDQWGYTNWYSTKTLGKVLEVLRDYRSSALAFAAKCDLLEKKVAQVLQRKQEDERAETEEAVS